MRDVRNKSLVDFWVVTPGVFGENWRIPFLQTAIFPLSWCSAALPKPCWEELIQWNHLENSLLFQDSGWLLGSKRNKSMHLGEVVFFFFLRYFRYSPLMEVLKTPGRIAPNPLFLNTLKTEISAKKMKGKGSILVFVMGFQRKVQVLTRGRGYLHCCLCWTARFLVLPEPQTWRVSLQFPWFWHPLQGTKRSVSFTQSLERSVQAEN